MDFSNIVYMFILALCVRRSHIIRTMKSTNTLKEVIKWWLMMTCQVFIFWRGYL